MAACFMACIWHYSTPEFDSDNVSDLIISKNQDYHKNIQPLKDGSILVNNREENYKQTYQLPYGQKMHQVPNTHFFPESFSKMIDNLGHLRISGFEFCSILNNARFNPWVHICTFLEI
jgi:hypothetical protein